jgi:hypothetical protein
VSGDLVGRAVNAVLIPPQAERFASLVGADTSRLTLNVSGWNKLVLMDADRVFLFPRSADGVEWFERELAAYRALAGARPPRRPVPPSGREDGARTRSGGGWTPTTARWRPP